VDEIYVRCALHKGIESSTPHSRKPSVRLEIERYYNQKLWELDIEELKERFGKFYDWARDKEGRYRLVFNPIPITDDEKEAIEGLAQKFQEYETLSNIVGPPGEGDTARFRQTTASYNEFESERESLRNFIDHESDVLGDIEKRFDAVLDAMMRRDRKDHRRAFAHVLYEHYRNIRMCRDSLTQWRSLRIDFRSANRRWVSATMDRRESTPAASPIEMENKGSWAVF